MAHRGAEMYAVLRRAAYQELIQAELEDDLE